MSISLTSRRDFTIPHYCQVAWQGESITVAPAARHKIEQCREAFLKLIDNDPSITVYGVTSGYGQKASTRLSAEERTNHARMPPFSSMSGFGGDLPQRIKRGMVFCRLTNFIEGHSAISAELVESVARLLDQPLPKVPAQGNASAGEIIPLSHLFTSLWQTHTLAEKEALALINGSPCASALMADIALSAERRLQLCLEVFALSAAAIAAPVEHYDPALSELYGDPAQAEILHHLAHLIGRPSNPRPYQAPVSWRIVPRVLGQLLRAHQQLREAATIGLQSITDNPIYLGPDDNHPNGRVLSNGGFHNANACPSIDLISGAYADIALLCDRQISKLFDANVSRLPANLQKGDGYAGCLGFIAADFAEQARHHAQRTALIGSEGGGFGQNDVLQPVFHAWQKAEECGRCLDATLAILAVTCSQAYHATDSTNFPAELEQLLAEIRYYVPPLSTPRALGLSVGDVAELLTNKVYQFCTTD